MDKKEFATFAAALKTYYPREQLLPNNQAMELWFRQLQDIPYEVAEAGLNKWVATNKWSPSIADIREMATNIVDGDIPAWGEAWEQVIRAIRTHGYYRVSETLEMLDPLTKKVVEQMGGVRKLCMSDTPDVDRANFRMMYETLAKRQHEDRLLPDKLKLMIYEMQEQKMLEGAIEQGGVGKLVE